MLLSVGLSDCSESDASGVGVLFRTPLLLVPYR